MPRQLFREIPQVANQASSLSYEPLSTEKNDIRILVIEPRENHDDSSEFRCRLEHVPLALSSNYVALSYCWGPPNSVASIRIDGQVHAVQPSLACALIELRRRRHLRVWADAICINQSDAEERSQQVLRMAAIYRSATSVVAWIGDGDDEDVASFLALAKNVKTLLGFNNDNDLFQRRLTSMQVHKGHGGKSPSETALMSKQQQKLLGTLDPKMQRGALCRVLRGVHKFRNPKPQIDPVLGPDPLDLWSEKNKPRVQHTRDADRHIQDHLSDGHWLALARLLDCEYWGRVWIIQELAMANQLEVIWGRSAIPYTDIVAVANAYRVFCVFGMAGSGVAVSETACRHVANLQQFEQMQRRLEPMPLISALQATAYACSTDVRDKVYGLMGLTYDGSIIFPTPSYKRPVWDINADAMMRIIQLRHTLDYFVFRSTGPGSWCINWFDPRTWSDARAMQHLTKKNTPEATAAKSKGTTTARWNATGSKRPRVVLDGRRLRVAGEVIDTVRDCSATFEERKAKKSPHRGRGKGKKGWKRRQDRSKTISPNEARDRIYGALTVANQRLLLERNEFLYALYYALKAVGDKVSMKDKETSAGAKEIREWLLCDGNAEFSIGNEWLSTLLTTSKNETSFSEPFFLLGDKVCRRVFHYEVMKSGMRSAVKETLEMLRMGMRMGETTGGRVGWFAKEAMPGDAIALMHGCSVPVVLRKQEDGTYIVVGDSIIPGLMHSEKDIKAKHEVILC
ncbi:hypothetical protein OQA88_1272 [Cercophora sp. LCS_1]